MIGKLHWKRNRMTFEVERRRHPMLDTSRAWLCRLWTASRNCTRHCAKNCRHAATSGCRMHAVTAQATCPSLSADMRGTQTPRQVLLLDFGASDVSLRPTFAGLSRAEYRPVCAHQQHSSCRTQMLTEASGAACPSRPVPPAPRGQTSAGSRSCSVSAAGVGQRNKNTQ